MSKFFFTFGQGHTFIGGSLANRFVILEAESREEAQGMMSQRRGAKWSSCYDSAEAAGVEKYGMIELPFEDLVDPVTYHIIFHRADLDGIGSAMVVLKHLLEQGKQSSEIKLHAWNYSEPMPSYQNGDHVFIVDCAPDWPEMLALHMGEMNGLVHVCWIDHHKTSYDDSVRNDYDKMGGLRTLHRPSAVELCWSHFFGPDIPEGIRLLSQYDTWCNEDVWRWENEILPFQFGMKLNNWLDRMMRPDNDTERMCIMVDNFISDCRNVSQLTDTGRTIMDYQKSEDEKTSKRAFSYRFHGITFAVLNTAGNSNTFRNIPFMHEARMLFFYDPKILKWKFSMYGVDHKGNKPHHDLSVIAKKLGGGGHKHACGFEVLDLKDVFGEAPIGYEEPPLF